MASKKPAKKAAAKKPAPRKAAASSTPPTKPPAGQDNLFANPDTIQPVQLQDEMERSFLDYAMSVKIGRAHV